MYYEDEVYPYVIACVGGFAS